MEEDSVRTKYLPKFKSAGINWLCLGIESVIELLDKRSVKEVLKM